MIYALEEKLWSLRDRYRILDVEGQPVFAVEGKLFSWGKRLSFQDAVGRELLHIRQKLLSLRPRYLLSRDGRQVGEVVRTWSFRARFALRFEGTGDVEVDGNFWAYEFTFRQGERVLARVSKKLFSWTDRYAVEVEEGVDDVMVLATVIVIDAVCHSDDGVPTSSG